MKKNHAAHTAVFAVLLLLFGAPRAFAAHPRLVPVGIAAGIALETDGVIVVGFPDVSPAKDAGLEIGDTILSLNDSRVDSASELSGALAAGEGDVKLEIRRGGNERTIRVTPDRSGETPRLGVFVRDAMAGIGTVTYYDPATGAFGALGHGIGEPNAQTLLPVGKGRLVPCTLDRIRPGAPGIPGELSGSLDAEKTLGTIGRNTAFGIFGQCASPFPGEAVEILPGPHVRTGEAVIRSAVGGEVRDYAIRILALCPSDGSGREMQIEVTDPQLLALTGGIVRGMSGSPILQDGKLAGAVTHVLVSDPKRGYGVLIGTMLDAQREGADIAENAA